MKNITADDAGPNCSAPGLISVVITCYNHGRFLSEAIDSVMNQTLGSSEIIVVDDGSIDDTAEVAGRHDVRYHHQENAGLPAARNAGLRLARGEFVLFLDADDRLLPTALAIAKDHLTCHPAHAFVSGNYIWIDGNGRPLDGGKPRGEIVEDNHYDALLRSNYIGMHGTVLYRRDLLLAAGGYREDLKACEDYEVYLRLAKDHPVGCLPKVAAEYRQHGTNMTGNPTLMLETGIDVLKSAVVPPGNRQLTAARRAGLKFMRRRYGRLIFMKILQGIRDRRPIGETFRGLTDLVRLVPPTTFLSTETMQAGLRVLAGQSRTPGHLQSRRPKVSS